MTTDDTSDKAGDDNASSGKAPTNINTEGGAAIIDNQLGAGNIVTDGAFYGPVIGKQVIQSALSPALYQLRAPVADFVGREQEIEQLVQALSKANGAAATISGVRGLGGIGKTELAHVVAIISPSSSLMRRSSSSCACQQ